MRAKGFLMAAMVVALAGCATVDFQPYEGKNAVSEGQGGTKIVVDDVDFWSNGEPPRKFKLIGVIDSEVGSGIGDTDMIRSAVAKEVKERGGNAVIQLSSSSSMSGIYRASPALYVPLGQKRIKFAVLRYVD